MSRNNTVRDALAQEFVKALNEDQLPWEAMWISQRAHNAVSGKTYRGVNALWLSMVAAEKDYSDPRWCTFKQAKAAGWHVRKGEKGTHVEFWSVYDTKTRKTISISEANRIVAADEDRQKDMRVVARMYTVFNAMQMDGVPALEMKEPVNAASIRAQRDVLLRNMGLGFHEGGDQAFYRPSEDSVTMPPDSAFTDEYGYMSVFLHECGHATGHASRLNRDLSGGFGSENYAKEELRAELASAFTTQTLGFGLSDRERDSVMDNHKAYIQSWAKAIQDAPNELFAAIKDAEKISDYLIEKGEFCLDEPEKKPALEEQIAEADKCSGGAREDVSREVPVER